MTDVQKVQVESRIKGKVVQWMLPIHEVSKSNDQIWISAPMQLLRAPSPV